MGLLDDKVAIVTGAAQGLGLAQGLYMARAGASVVLADIRDDEGQAAADDATGKGLAVQYRRLDVTDPEPLPDGHPLWSEPRCIITPHVGNTREMGRPLLATRVRENVERYGRGEPLVGVVDTSLGY